MESKYPSAKRGDKSLDSGKPILTYVHTQKIVLTAGGTQEGGKEGGERPELEGPPRDIGAQCRTSFLLAAQGGPSNSWTPRVPDVPLQRVGGGLPSKALSLHGGHSRAADLEEPRGPGTSRGCGPLAARQDAHPENRGP